VNAGNFRAFRAMFWKEYRENAKWAALAAVGLLLSIVIMAAQPGQGYHYKAKPFYDFWRSVNGDVVLGSALTALLLGMLQIFPERRRDQWAFLMHRPTPRAWIFWGKACAGLSLYALATAVPLVAVSAWAAAPGHVAGPFDPRLMLAGFAAIACGAIIYFAALIVALRSVPWYGSRLLPLATGYVLAFAIYTIPQEFWQTIALLPLAIAPLALAALSAFSASENEASPSKAGRASTILTVFLGALTACAVVLVMPGNLLSSVSLARDPIRIELYAALKTGQIVRVTQVHQPAGGSSLQEVRDVAGHPLHASYADLNFPQILSFNSVANSSMTRRYTEPQRYVYDVTFTPGVGAGDYAWFYIASRHRVAMYSTKDSRLLGEIGPSGAVAAGGGQPSSFPSPYSTLSAIDSSDNVFWVFGPQIYRLTSENTGGWAPPLGQLHVSPFLSAPLKEDIRSLVSSPFHENEYFVTTDHSVDIFDAKGSLRFSAPTSPGWSAGFTALPRMTGAALHGRNAEHYLMWLCPSEGQPDRVAEYTADGRLLQIQPLPPLYTPSLPTDWGSSLYAAFVPVILVIMEASHILGLVTFASVNVALVAGLTWATLCWLAAHRSGLPIRARGISALAGAFLGMPALMTILSIYRWPALVTCSQCGKKRAVTQEPCEHCGAAFSEPARDGTEIFESPTLVMHTEAA
jgi:hypothetical protein